MSKDKKKKDEIDDKEKEEKSLEAGDKVEAVPGKEKQPKTHPKGKVRVKTKMTTSTMKALVMEKIKEKVMEKIKDKIIEKGDLTEDDLTPKQEEPKENNFDQKCASSKAMQLDQANHAIINGINRTNIDAQFKDWNPSTKIFKADGAHWLHDKEKGWESMHHVKQANKDAGHSWFGQKEKKFFNSKLHGDIKHGKYFISSEKGPDDVRKYSVREAHPTGKIGTVGEQGQFKDLQSARAHIKENLSPKKENK